MSDSYQWDFGSEGSGLQFKVVFDGTNFTVTCISGSMDLNALWFSDGDKYIEGTTTLTKSDSSLNLNGTGITWDDYYKVSSTGLGAAGEAKVSFLTAGESLSFSLQTLQLPSSITSLLDSDPALLTIGVRTTSNSSLSGDGKFVDTSATTLSSVSINQAPTLDAVSGGTVTDTLADDTYADVNGNLSGSDPDGDTVWFELADSSATPEGADRAAGFNVQQSSAYGTFFLNTSSGAYKFVADDSAVEALKAVQTVDFVVNATDGSAASTGQTITITLDGINDTPELSATLTAHTYTDTDGDDSFANVAGTLSTLDRDSGETATYAIDDASVETGSYTVGSNSYSQKLVGTYGTLYLNASGAYEFVPLDAAIEALEASTSESFTFTVTDSSSATATQTLTITLDGAEDKPEVAAVVASYADTAADDSFADKTGTLSVTSRDGDTSFVFALDGSSATPDGAEKAAGYDLQNTSSTYGTLYLNSATGAYKFVANDAAIEALEAGATPSVVFDVTASADGATSDSQTITITISGAEDKPVVAAVVGTYADMAGDDSFADKTGTLSVTSRDGDTSFAFALGGSSATPDGAEKTAGYDLQNTSSTYGTLYLNSATGAYKFVANDAAIEALEAGDTPSVVFDVTASADGATSDSQTITITISGAEDKPVVAAVVGTYADTAADDTFADKTGTLSVTSRDGDTSFAFALAGSSASVAAGYDLQNTSSAYGTLYLNSLTGAYKFVANDAAIEALAYGSNPSLVFNVTATADGVSSDSQTLTINITGDNDAARDLVLTAVSFAGGNGLPNSTAVGQLSVPAGADPDAGGAYTYSLDNAKVGALGTATISTDASALFSVSTTGLLSTTGALSDGSIYEVAVKVSQGTGAEEAVYSETFSIVTGTNAATENIPGSGYDFSTGDDVIYGRQNVDIIYAGSGNDTVFGQGGNDEIHGGTGVDLLYGGNNNDTFVFASGDTGITLATADTIGDFISSSGQENDTISTSLAAGNVTIANGGGLADFNAFVNAANAVLTAGAGTNDAYMAYNAAGSGNGWLVIDENDSGSIDAGDSLIVLTGVNLASEFTTSDIA